MKNNLTIKEIQEWEKSFVKKKGISQKEEEAIKIAIFKLVEEIGEVAKAVLEENWNEVLAEVSDVIIFACKVANIAEKFHKTDTLTNIIRKKIKYCEKRKYNAKTRKFNKPTNKEFK